MTHALSEIWNGNFRSAWEYNALSFTVLPIVCIYLLYRSVREAMGKAEGFYIWEYILLAGLLVWGVIAVFTTAGGCAIWVHLARKNGRLELIQQKMNEAKRERIVTPTLVIGMVLAVAFMVIIEIF